MTRCAWAQSDELLQQYHDTQWGVPVHDDQLLYEMLILEGAQAGLSWLTVLQRREGYRQAFAGFDPAQVAQFSIQQQEKLRENSGIIRNRLKIKSAVTNAQKFLEVQKEFGSFTAYLWKFVDNQPIQNSWKSLQEIPTSTEISDTLSKDLKKRGFSFVGSTICYAYMQAVGLANDHEVGCFRHAELSDSK